MLFAATVTDNLFLVTFSWRLSGVLTQQFIAGPFPWLWSKHERLKALTPARHLDLRLA